MKERTRMKELYALFTSALDGGELLASSSDRFYPEVDRRAESV